jgi:hypothetical protein|tara:strand:- start:26 stop:1330 length:1305 start_codon:yes stop_codon:yes gene_type:complete
MAKVATDEAEGAQALFCYIADILGASETEKQFAPYLEDKNSEKFFETYKGIIDKAYDTNQVDTGKTQPVIIKYVENNPDWFVSSLKIAEKIITKIDDIDKDFGKITKPGWDDLYYVHGDEDVMKVMADLYKSANYQSAKQPGAVGRYFGNINKWSPADIYFASKDAKDTLMKLKNEDQTKKNNLTFAVLNKTVQNLIDSGDLLPLSLKKAIHDVVIKKVNFDVDKREKLLAETFCEGVEPWKKMTANYKSTKNKSFEWTRKPSYTGGREIKLAIESGGKKGTIQMRATPASGGKPSAGIKVILKYTGSSALGGQVASIPLFQRIIDTVDKPFGEKIRRDWDANYKKFKDVADAYIEFGGGEALYLKGKKDNKAKKQFNDDIGAISGEIMMNPFRDEIADYFKNPKEAQNNIMRALFAYVSSRTPFSARFVIAKD